ncbi:MAG TPA: sodium:alanine symporter family protein [Verrucomicrobiae bacterium]|nr:sodium:alanine symporter family protein [Verrucomicrobiae bacterium]
MQPPPPSQVEAFLNTISGWVWGPPLLILLCGTHLFLTFRLGIIQRLLPRGIRLSLATKREGEGDISHYGALSTALAATIGTGNIIGVATAITLGGPGAVFWMWLTGVFGIATKYSEALLSVKYRVRKPDGTMAGGPMYVLERAMNAKWLAVLFAGFTAVAAFGIGNMVQANSITANIGHLLKDNFGANDSAIMASNIACGLIMATLTGAVILGGIRKIAHVCAWLVPFMAVAYVVGCLIILTRNAAHIPDAIRVILSSAFSGHAAVGAFVGVTMREALRFGVARGLFSNESGLGSAPIVAAAAQTTHPVRQALVASTGTFWDTVIICAMTGLTLVTSGYWKQGTESTKLTQAAFGDVPGGQYLLLFGLLTFIFSTILGWAYYGEKAAEYLFGPRATVPYRWLWVVAVFLGSIFSLNAVWTFADIANGLMAIPNLISLIALSGVIVVETREYLRSHPKED